MLPMLPLLVPLLLLLLLPMLPLLLPLLLPYATYAAPATAADLLVPLGGAGVGHVLQLKQNMVGEHS